MNLAQKTKTVSVVISHYNKAKYLDQAIYSITNQSHQPKEIIVVDDCSVPEQQARAKRICDRSGALFIQRSQNGGPSKARNDGIKAADGEWIQIIDADDFLTKDSLKSRLAVLQTHADTLWIAGQYAYVKRFVTPKRLENKYLTHLPWFKLRPVPVIEPHHVSPEDPWVVKWPHVVILFHRSLFEKYGLYDEEVRLGQDKEIRWRFWFFSQTIPRSINEIVYIYRRGVNGQLTHKKNKRERQRSREIMLQNLEKRKTEGLKPQNTTLIGM